MVIVNLRRRFVMVNSIHGIWMGRPKVNMRSVLSNLFSYTLSLRSSLNVSDQV